MSSQKDTENKLTNRDNRDTLDKLHAKLAQLSAMTGTIYGEGFENFKAHNDEIKHNYLWALADMTDEARNLASQLAYR